MTINLTSLFGITPANSAALTKSVNFKSGANVTAFNFEGLEPSQDKFSTNPITMRSKAEIEQIAKSSPRIMALLKEHNLPLRVNIDVLEDMR